MSMSNPPDESLADDWGKSQESRSANRIGPMINRMLVQGSEAQKSAARTIEKNARYMLWAVGLAAVSTVITAAGVVFCVVVYLTHVPH